MGFLNKLFGGDAGIFEAMYETYSKLKNMHPNLEEHEILALVLHHRFKKLQPEIGLLIAVLFPRIDILTEWVVGLEKTGGPKYLDAYLARTTNLDEREKALDYIQKKALQKVTPKFESINTDPKNVEVSEDIVDGSAEVLWDRFIDRLNYSFEEDSKPLTHLSAELRNTVANIYYRFFKFCTENKSGCENIEEIIEEKKRAIERQIDSWESTLEAIITLTSKSFSNKIIADYAAINHSLEWLAGVHGKMPTELFKLSDDLLIAVFKYKINDAYSRTGASLVAECKMREDESDEIPNLMHYFEYSWGCHFDSPYKII